MKTEYDTCALPYQTGPAPDNVTHKEEHREFFFGEWLTKEELVNKIQETSGCRGTFVIDEHIDGMLYIRVPFGGDND